MSQRPKRRIVVAIDGPAGAGKSTVSKRLTEKLGYRLLDTGALYRAVALVSRRQGIDWTDEDRVARVAADLEVSFEIHGDENHCLVGDDDVSTKIRTPEISDGASRVSALPKVRAALLGLQKRLGQDGGVVAEGRDIGTVVFPDAEAKFFLTAAPEVRARRRYDELVARGTDVDYEATLAEMVDRDERDSNRAVAPLAQADDAVLVDSSGLTTDEVVDRMLAIVRKAELSAS